MDAPTLEDVPFTEAFLRASVGSVRLSGVYNALEKTAARLCGEPGHHRGAVDIDLDLHQRSRLPGGPQCWFPAIRSLVGLFRLERGFPFARNHFSWLLLGNIF